jgi:hypothetical protein
MGTSVSVGLCVFWGVGVGCGRVGERVCGGQVGMPVSC